MIKKSILVQNTNMISKQTEDGFVGVNSNCDKTHVLLQLTKEKEQIRIKLTPKETLELIKRLSQHLQEIELKTFISNYGS